jgi:hypothetical protein
MRKTSTIPRTFDNLKVGALFRINFARQGSKPAGVKDLLPSASLLYLKLDGVCIIDVEEEEGNSLRNAVTENGTLVNLPADTEVDEYSVAVQPLLADDKGQIIPDESGTLVRK